MGKLVNLLENNVSVFIGEPTSIDPCFGSEHDGALILRFLCDPLIDFDPKTGGPSLRQQNHGALRNQEEQLDFSCEKEYSSIMEERWLPKIMFTLGIG